MATEKVKYELTLRDLMSRGLGDINSKLGQLEGKLKSTEKSCNNMSAGLGSAMKKIGVAAALYKMAEFGKEVIVTTARFQSLSNSIKFASDTAVQGESSMIWISDLSKKYGLPIEETAEGFKTLQGAMMKTRFSSSDVRHMFAQVSTGIVAMGLSAEDAKGTFLALGQIMGKGKVQAEELRGQIGERIPGAFSIAARAMGVTTSQLDKMMKDGKLLSEDFLPKFAAEMEKTFGKGAESNVDSLASSIKRLSNSWTEMMVSIGNSDEKGIMSQTLNLLAKGIDKVGDSFKSFDQKSREVINDDLIKYLDVVTIKQKSLLSEYKEKGVNKNDTSEALEKQREQEYSSLDSRYEKYENELVKLRAHWAEISTLDTNGTKEQIDKDMRTISEARGSDDLDKIEFLLEKKRLYEESKKGVQQAYDKTISDVYKDEGFSSKSYSETKEKTDKELKEASGSVSGATPKTVNINIEGLIKGTVNNIINNANNPKADLKSFMDNLEEGLLTIVTDVSIQQI